MELDVDVSGKTVYFILEVSKTLNLTLVEPPVIRRIISLDSISVW